jgi:hypothetical protein
MAWVNPATVATGDVLTASKWNQDVVANTTSLPRGVMGYATRSTNLSVTTSEADVGLSVTFTAEANRYYRYTVFIPSADGDANNLTLKLTNSSNTSVYRVIQEQDGPAQFQAFQMEFITTETAGSVTRKVRAVTSTGGATFQLDATNIGWLLVEDIGAV